MTAAPSWIQDAACGPEHLRLFFGPDIEHPADKQARETEAVAVCADCPVTGPCLEWALSFPSQHGVAGGVGEDQRTPMRHAWLKRQQRATERKVA